MESKYENVTGIHFVNKKTDTEICTYAYTLGI